MAEDTTQEKISVAFGVDLDESNQQIEQKLAEESQVSSQQGNPYDAADALIGAQLKTENSLLELGSIQGNPLDDAVKAHSEGLGTSFKESQKAATNQAQQRTVAATLYQVPKENIQQAVDFINSLGVNQIDDFIFMDSQAGDMDAARRAVGKRASDLTKKIAEGGMYSRGGQKAQAQLSLLNEEYAAEQKQMMVDKQWQEATVTLLAAGYTGEQVTSMVATAKAKYGDERGIEAAYPELIVFDVLSGGSFRVAKEVGMGTGKSLLTSFATGFFPETAIPLYARGIRELGLKKTARVAGQGIRESVAIGGAFYVTATALEEELGPVAAEFTAMFGVAGAAGIFSMTRPTLQAWLTATKENNPKIYRDFKRIATSLENPYTQQVKEIIADIEAGKIGTEGTKRVHYVDKSPVSQTAQVAAATGDESARQAIKDTVMAAAADPGEAGTLARTASGLDMDTAPLTLFPDSQLGEVIPMTTETGNIIPSVLPAEVETKLMNSAIISKTIGQEAFEAIMHAAELTPESDLVARIYPNMEYRTGQLAAEAGAGMVAGKVGSEKTTSYIKSKFVNLMSHQAWLGSLSKAIVDIPTALTREAKRLNLILNEKMDKEVFSGLAREDRKFLDDLIDEGDNYEALWVPQGDGSYILRGVENAQPRFIPDHVYQRYAKLQAITWESWLAANKVEAQRLANAGYKQFGSVVVKEVSVNSPKVQVGMADSTGQIWTDEMKKNGWKPLQVYNTLDPSDAKPMFIWASPEDTAKILTEMDPAVKLLPFREGYFPRIYDKNASRFVVTHIKKHSDGSFSVEQPVAARNYREAQKAAEIVQKNVGNDVVVAMRRGQASEWIDLVTKNKHAQFLSALDDHTRSKLSAALTDAGWDKQQLDAFFAHSDTVGSYKPGIFRERTEAGMKSAQSVIEKGQVLGAERAKLVPTVDAYRTYNARISNFIANADWKENLKKWYVQRYKYILADGEGSHWKETPFRKGMEESADALEAEGVRRRLLTALDIMDPNMLKAQSKMMAKTDQIWRKGTPMAELQARLLDDFAPFGEGRAFAEMTKSIGATAFLGWFNLAQIAVQSTVMLNSAVFAGSNPKALALGLSDFLKLTGQGVLMNAKGSEGAYLRELVKHAGPNAHLYTDDLFESFTHMANKDYASLIGRGYNKLKRTGLAPFRMGEKIGKVQVWLANRRVLMEEMENGLHANLNMKIDDDLFLSLVTTRTDEMTGNFTKHNRQFYLTGQGTGTEAFLSSLLQFKSFPFFQTGYMFSSKHNIYQRTALWAAWLGAFGLEAVPHFYDVAHIGEGIANQFTDEVDKAEYTRRYGVAWLEAAAGQVIDMKNVDDETKRFMRLFTAKGALAAYTDGYIDMAVRASNAEQFSNFVDGLTYQELAGPGMSVLINMAKKTGPAAFDLFAMAIDEERRNNATHAEVRRDVQQLVAPWSGPSNVSRAFEPEMIHDKNGRPLIGDPTPTDRAMIAVGITPGNVNERKMNERLEFKADEELRIEMREVSRKAARMMIDNPVTGSAYMNEQFARFSDINKGGNPVMAMEFMKDVLSESQALQLPPEEARRFRMLNRALRGKPVVTPLEAGGLSDIDELREE